MHNVMQMSETQLEGVDRRKNEQFHRRLQTIRSIGSAFVAAALVAALAGAFGSGPLNLVTRHAGGLSAQYPRALRLLAPAEIRLRIPTSGSATTAEVTFNEDYIHALEVVGVTPPPLDTHNAGNGIVYRFHQVSGPAANVVFRIKPVTTGRLTAEVTTSTQRGSGASLRFQQLVLP